MAFYIRKSLRMGPVRLNVSKSGLGVSAGVRGARVGVNAKGKSYVHAGRHGAYYRKQFDSASSKAGQGAARSATRPESVILYQRTDAAYTGTWTGPEQRLLTASGSPRIEFKYGWVAVTGGLVLTLLGSGAALMFGASAMVAGLGYLVWANRRNRSHQTLRNLLETLTSGGSWQEQRWRELKSFLAEQRLPGETAQAELRRAYLQACRAIVEDGVVEESELELLTHLEGLIDDSRFIGSAKVDAFRGLYFMVVADHDLDEEEEKSLDHVRQSLGVSAEDVREELGFLERLRELRAVRSGELPEVAPPVPIQKSETCYFSAPGRLLKEKQLRTFQKNGQKYKLRGLVEDKEGTLLITNKRVLLVHSGTSTVRHDKVLDIELDMEENVVRLTKDGAKTPTILSTPDAVRAAAIIGVLSGVDAPRAPA